MPESLPAEDLAFADLAVQQGLVSREKADECLLTLRRLREAGVSPLPRLGDLLRQSGALATSSAEVTLRGPAPSETSAATVVREGSGIDLKSRGAGASPARPYRHESAFESRYAVAGEIARGGMGVILDGKDLEIRRELAIKVLQDSPGSAPERVAKFVEEAQIQGQLEHPNICPVHELGTDAQGRPYFTMKKVKGRSLAQLLEAIRSGSERGYSLARLLDIFCKVCDAISFAHSRGVIHRDLKPENIMIGEFGEVLAMDWGLAKIVGREDIHLGRLVISDRAETSALLSVEGTVMGTPSYMPPEQARGRVDEIDERSDIYALGGILYAILTLRHPVEGENVREVLDRVANGRIVPPSERAPGRPVPADLEAAAMKALARRREDRYATVMQLKADMTAFLEGRALSAAEYSLFQLAAKWFRRNRVFALTALAAAAVIVAGAVFYVVAVSRERAAAEAEARRARAAEGEARRQSGLADEARRGAELRLAEGLVAQGDALGLANRWGEARARYQESGEAFARTGASTLPADLGLREAERRSPPPLATMTGHGSGVFSAALSRDGRRILSGGAEGNVRLWDAATGTTLRTFSGPTGAVWCAVFSPDERRVLAGSWDGTARVWDAGSGREVCVFRGHKGQVCGAAYTSDGSLAVSGGGQDGTAKLWDAETGRLVRSFDGHALGVYGLAFSPDDALLLTTSEDRTARLWNVETGALVRVLEGHQHAATYASFSPDGRRALTGSKDGTIRLWDLQTGRTVRTLAGHTNAVWQVSFSPDGTFALSGSTDGTMRLWDLESGEALRTYWGHTDDVYAAAFSRDGRMAVSASWDGSVRLWDLEPSRARPSFGVHDGAVTSVAYSPDGRLAVSSGADGRLRLFDAATGQILRAIDAHPGGAYAAAFSPDGRRALTGGADRTARLWDLSDGRSLKTLEGHEGPVSCVAFLPDGRRALSGSADRIVRLWDLESGKTQRVFTGHTNVVLCVTASPDRRHAVSGSLDYSARLWDLETGAEVRSFSTDSHGTFAAAFSPDGSRLLTGIGREMAMLWDVATGKEIRTFSGHTHCVDGVAFSADGRLAVSGSQDKSVRLWDLATGREIRVLEGHQDHVLSVALSPDGRRVLAGSRDRTMSLWDLTSPRDREFEARLAAARAEPEKPASQESFGVWFAERGLWTWAVEFLDRARSDGAAVSSLLLGRCRWRAGDRAGAAREFEKARAAGEAPEFYLDLCLGALRR
jgi:WD40 repeat protein